MSPKQQHITFKFIPVLFLAGILFVSCTSPSPSVSVSKTVNLASLSGEDVYFVFTNTSTSSSAPAAPTIRSNSRISDETPRAGRPVEELPEDTFPRITDEMRWRNNPGQLIENSSRAASASRTYAPLTETVGSSRTFRTETNESTVATCRKKVQADGKTLLIYVADESWTVLPDESKISQNKVDVMAEKFLKAGSNNDIWDWTTDLLGAPWGSHSYNNLIANGAQDYITILLYDIKADADQGTTVGYFDTTHNFLNTSGSSRSQERLFFAIDSYLYAKKTGAAWDAGDAWPREVFSTLAHEFQHMIFFYQKQIAQKTDYAEVWLNEMCSMIVEDLLADKIGIPGPRDVIPTIQNAGPVLSNWGRLNLYNARPDRSLTSWGGSEVLYDYASAYSFGAFISRNYGGAALLRRIVQNPYLDESAVTNAVTGMGYGEKDFTLLLQEWAAASIKSDTISTAIPSFNRNSFVATYPNGSTGTLYNLGGINLYNYAVYRNTSESGPMTYAGPGVFSSATYPLGEMRPGGPASNIIILAGENLSGSHSWTVSIPTGSVFSIVRK